MSEDLSVFEMLARIEDYENNLHESNNKNYDAIQIDFELIDNFSNFISSVCQIVKDKIFSYFEKILSNKGFSVNISKNRKSHIVLSAKKDDIEIKIEYFNLANQRIQYKISLMVDERLIKTEELKSFDRLNYFIGE